MTSQKYDIIDGPSLHALELAMCDPRPMNGARRYLHFTTNRTRWPGDEKIVFFVSGLKWTSESCLDLMIEGRLVSETSPLVSGESSPPLLFLAKYIVNGRKGWIELIDPIAVERERVNKENPRCCDAFMD